MATEADTCSHLRKVPVPLPLRPEQLRIVQELGEFQTKADASRRVHGEIETELDVLLSSILDSAFKGQL